jgi:hypothetical protein
MRHRLLIVAFLTAITQTSFALDLVTDEQPVAEIVIANDCDLATKSAATELQRRIAQMSGATLNIVDAKSPDVKTQVYVGTSDYTKQLGVTTDDIRHDGYKVIVGNDHVVLIGKELYFSQTTFAMYVDKPRALTKEAWQTLTGQKWRTPSFYTENDYSKELGFHVDDGTGTLYAVYDLLQQLGMRWYMPSAELGVVIPTLKTITVKPQSLKREPEFGQRRFRNATRGQYKEEMLWYKSMKVGTSSVIPLYHAVGRLTYFGKDANPEYFGTINGKLSYNTPKLSSQKLRADFVTSLKFTREVYPGIEYDSLGQPDGWSTMDSADAAAGWLQESRGTYGNFSNYAWDFNMDIRKRVMAENPERKFTVFAYSGSTMPPTNFQSVPDNVTVGILQRSPSWMLAPGTGDLALREEWLKRMSDGKKQLLILDHYLEHAPIRSTPPVPVIYTKFLQTNLKAAYDRSVGYDIEVPWIPSNEAAATKSQQSLRRPALSHLMIYLHARMLWERDMDVPAVLNEYYDLFYGPAKAQMKEFFEFSEEVWTRPLARQVTPNGGFLKQADVDRYFEILKRASDKAGDSIYGKRIDLLKSEMAPLHKLFENLQRTGGLIAGTYAKHPVKIDGDLTKPFWNEPDGPASAPLRDLTTGNIPTHVDTNVSFRWLPDDSGLVVGIECIEPKMDKLRFSCKDRDSYSIFADDNVEIRLETAQGIRPFVAINPNGAVFDECVTERAEELPSFYTVSQIAVRRLADRWTVEALIETKPIAGTRPDKTFPWGVNICRQRMASNFAETYMLFPSGTKFRDAKAMGDLVIRR